MFDIYGPAGYVSANLITESNNWWTQIINPNLGQLGPYNVWELQLRRYMHYDKYFSGRIFLTTVGGGEAKNDTIEPLMQPVGMNISKMLCLAMADALFGEWRRHVIGFSVVPRDPKHKEEVNDHDGDEIDPEHPDKDIDDIKVVERWLEDMFWNDNRADTLLWEEALDQQHYGGSYIRVKPSMRPDNLSGIQFERVEPTCVYPIWSPDDYAEITEAYVAMRIPVYVARQLYGDKFTTAAPIPPPSSKGMIDANPTVVRVEHWLKRGYETYLNGTKINSMSGEHDFGDVPILYTPRMRDGVSAFFGPSTIEDIWRVSDEINMRVADIGEALNYNTHPIKYGYNLPADFSTEKFTFDPSSVWNFGRSISDLKPELHLLESKHPVPVESFKHIKFLYDWARTASNAPPIAFGEDEGSQRSGQTLVIRLWPMLRAVMRSRAYNADTYIRMIRLAFNMVKARRPKNVDPRLYEAFPRMKIGVVWSPIIPRDRQAIVDEMVKRVSTTPRLVSLSTALTEFDDVQDLGAEVESIEEEFKKYPLSAGNNSTNAQGMGKNGAPSSQSLGAE